MITDKGETEDQAPAVASQEVPLAENIATTEVVPEVNLEKEIALDEVSDQQKAPQERSKRGGGKCTSQGFKERSCFRSPDAGYSWGGGSQLPGVVRGSHLQYVVSSKGTTTEMPTEGVATTEVNVQFSVGSPESGRSTSAPSIVGSPSGIYQPGWGVTNHCRLDTPEACQDMVDHTVPPGFEQEVRLLKKARALVADGMRESILVREEEIKRLGEEVESLKVVEAEVHGLRNQTKNLETLLEAEVDMKKATEAKNAELAKELESLREERIKAAFEKFKKYEDNKVEQRCAEMDARLDKLSIDIDEELLDISHLLCHELLDKIRQAFANVVSAGLAKGMSEGLKYGIEYGKASRDLADVEAYDPEANNKLVKALQDLKDLKYSMVDQLENSSQLKIPIYPEVRAPEDPWAVKEEVPLEDAITANISWAEKKKKCRVVCRTHEIGFAHHARSDGVPVSVPTVVPQGLAILLADSEDKASPRLLRSKSLPPMYNLDWP
ncbi:hypothetical protein Tco_1146000 [Tanacetum coccineum]